MEFNRSTSIQFIYFSNFMTSNLRQCMFAQYTCILYDIVDTDWHFLQITVFKIFYFNRLTSCKQIFDWYMTCFCNCELCLISQIVWRNFILYLIDPHQFMPMQISWYIMTYISVYQESCWRLNYNRTTEYFLTLQFTFSCICDSRS